MHDAVKGLRSSSAKLFQNPIVATIQKKMDWMQMHLKEAADHKDDNGNKGHDRKKRKCRTEFI
jgi:hypothetical protein